MKSNFCRAIQERQHVRAADDARLTQQQQQIRGIFGTGITVLRDKDPYEERKAEARSETNPAPQVRELDVHLCYR